MASTVKGWEVVEACHFDNKKNPEKCCWSINTGDGTDIVDKK